MTISQVQAAALLIIVMIGTSSGLLLAFALLFPTQTEAAADHFSTKPTATLLTGVLMSIMYAVGLGLARAPGLLKLVGAVMLVVLTFSATVGLAGVAHLMSRRIQDVMEGHGGFGSMLGGTLILTLAMGFPLIGWFFFAPVVHRVGDGDVLAWAPTRWDYRSCAWRGAGSCMK